MQWPKAPLSPNQIAGFAAKRRKLDDILRPPPLIVIGSRIYETWPSYVVQPVLMFDADTPEPEAATQIIATLFDLGKKWWEANGLDL